MNIFKYLDYRVYLYDYLKSYKKINHQFSFQAIAKHLRIHQAYLSKVFRLDGHLNDDQIFLLLQVLKLNADETSYFKKIYDYSKSGMSERRKLLLKEIQQDQEDQLKSEKKLKAEILRTDSDSRLTEYYLNPQLQLIHTFLMVPRYQKNHLSILKHLSLSEAELTQAIETLVRLQIIEWNSDERKYRVLREHLHLSESAPLCTPWTALSRLVSNERLLSLHSDKKYVVSVTFSADRETQLQIKEELLDALKRIEGLVRKAPSDKIYQLDLDLFPWERD